MTKRRLISKSKTYGFNPWLDQIDTINQIMKESGEKTESVLLRKLVDEALTARRKKVQSLPLIEEPYEAGGRLQTIETLLMSVARQGDVAFRILDVLLALLQDVLAEAHATRRISWESQVLPRLREEGVDANELEQRFMQQAEPAKDFAYSLTARIKKSQQQAR